MRVRLSLLVAVVLVLSACSGEEIEGFLDLIPDSDLSQSADAGERAAGRSATDLLTVAEAEENLERGIVEGDVEAVRQASRLRPDDSRYHFYEAALLAGEDFATNEAAAAAYQVASRRGGFHFGAEHPEVENATERGRLAIETYLNALLDVIERSPAGPARDRRIESYCTGLTDFYAPGYTNHFPQEVALYLAVEADFTVCP